MAGQSHTTTDHQTIRRWVEERGGQPAAVKSTAGDDDVGVLRFDFPGYSGEQSLTPISWEAFFEKFDEKQLALVYQDETSSGGESRFSKLVSRDTAEGRQPREQPRATAQSEARQQESEALGEQTAARHPASQAARSPLQQATQQTIQALRQTIAWLVDTLRALLQAVVQWLQGSMRDAPDGQQRAV
jgi:hypothetical protein